jgi:hypothetical protein
MIDAIVVLPDHLHVVMTLPEGDADFPNRWRLIKRRFTTAVAKEGAPVARHRNGDHGASSWCAPIVPKGPRTAGSAHGGSRRPAPSRSDLQKMAYRSCGKGLPVLRSG